MILARIDRDLVRLLLLEISDLVVGMRASLKRLFDVCAETKAQSTRLKLLPLLAATWISLLLPAHARVRDDVMSSALHCAGIGDSRQWLDCYYGAAQVMRAQLGLSPVPPAQVKLVELPPVGGKIQDQHTRSIILSNAVRCDDLGTEPEWLKCYYDAALPMRSELGLPGGASAEKPMLQTSGSDSTASAQFGIVPHVANLGGQVVSRLVSYNFDHYGNFTVTLSNGQIWRQISGDTTYAHWNEIASNYTVVITRGALGSFNLRIQKSPGLFKVKRVS